jgi:lactaldehyde dehydrogenase/glycolaldehyde dehydrogenase
VFTDDYEVAMRAAEEIEFGETYVNRTLGEALQGHHIGWGESGVGGEDGKYGVLKYTQLKTVYHNY